jgi:hypothetical protein
VLSYRGVRLHPPHLAILVLRGQDLPKQSKKNTLSAQKLLSWVESELQKSEEEIKRQNSSGHPDSETISEREGRIWAYKLIRQFVQSGCADEEGAVCGACGGIKMYIATGQLVCDECYVVRGSECSMVPASSEEGKLAIRRRRNTASLGE